MSAVALLCAQISLAEAEDWPARPVRILVGFGAGGGTDVVARIVAEKLSEVLGQPFLVENQPGSGGTIAGGIVAGAPGDGYTGLVISAGHAISAVMVKKVPDHDRGYGVARADHQARVAVAGSPGKDAAGDRAA